MSFDPTQIRKAVTDAGFTPGEIELTAIGVLARTEELLVLEMTGRVKELVLAGGSRSVELRNKAELVGKRIRVRGQLHPRHADRPAGLTVESFESPIR